MPSRKKMLTGAAMRRRLKKGFGQGTGKDYRPYLRVSDVPSRGTCTIITGKDGREHHLLSRLERSYFYVLEFRDDVVEIREQFPLLPLESTLEIARSLGVRHPGVGGKPVIMTTDFLIGLNRGGKTIFVARTVKPHKELTNKRTLQKFEIERRYFEERGIDWAIVTDHELPAPYCRNMDWLHGARDINKLRPITPEGVSKVTAWLRSEIPTARTVGLALLCTRCDCALNLTSGFTLKVVRHLLANKILRVDVSKRISTHEPVTISFSATNHD